MTSHSLLATAAAAAVAIAGAGPSFAAQTATDGVGDFLPSFGGTAAPALDLVNARVVFDAAANTFTLKARAQGDIGALSTGAYVFGFHRGGSANQPFSAIGFGDIAFNAAAMLRSDGSGNVGAIPLSATVLGNSISAVLSADMLPGWGTAPQDFTWALWSVDLAVTGLSRNADFISSNNLSVSVVGLPRSAGFAIGDHLSVSAVPEPASVALMLAGLMGIGAAARSRRRV